MRSILGSIVFSLCVLLLTPEKAQGQGPGGMGMGMGGMAGAYPRGMGGAGGMGGYSGYGDGTGAGAGMLQPLLTMPSPVTVTYSDGTRSELTFTHNFAYYIAPGMAKPSRINLSKGARLIQARSTDFNNKITLDATPNVLKLIGTQHILSGVPLNTGRVIFALVDEQAAADEAVLVFQQKSPPAVATLGGEDMGMAEMAGSGEMGMSGGMGVGAIIVLSKFEEAKDFTLGAKNEPLAAEDVKILAELIRLDIKIEKGLSELSAQRQDADKFREVEAKLRSLLAREYQAQLARQRSDVARMNAKLKLLQEELQRREAATDRVVEVQLGKLVLEAQGLIGDRSTEGF